MPGISWMQALAVDLSLAALLGEDVYNFGELIAHPVVRFVHLVVRFQELGVVTNVSRACDRYLHVPMQLFSHTRAPISKQYCVRT
jgi:hypothetical protein